MSRTGNCRLRIDEFWAPMIWGGMVKTGPKKTNGLSDWRVIGIPDVSGAYSRASREHFGRQTPSRWFTREQISLECEGAGRVPDLQEETLLEKPAD